MWQLSLLLMLMQYNYVVVLHYCWHDNLWNVVLHCCQQNNMRQCCCTALLLTWQVTTCHNIVVLHYRRNDNVWQRRCTALSFRHNFTVQLTTALSFLSIHIYAVVLSDIRLLDNRWQRRMAPDSSFVPMVSFWRMHMSLPTSRLLLFVYTTVGLWREPSRPSIQCLTWPPSKSQRCVWMQLILEWWKDESWEVTGFEQSYLFPRVLC